MFRFSSVCEPDELPLRNGKLVQWYRYTLLAGNTNPSAEGVIGNSVAQSTTTVTATVQEFSDFTTLSTLLDETAIDPIVENHASNLGYRAGLTNDTLARNEFDANVATVGLSTLGATASTQDARQVVALLQGTNVRPREGDAYMGIIHPYALYDVKADNTAGGFIDVMKYADPSALKGAVPFAGEDGMVGGVRLVRSTNVGTTGSAPNVLYYWYIVGKGAVGQVTLAGRGPTNVVDPSKQNFRVAVVRGGQPSMYDPEGKIGAAVSYRFVQVFKTLDSTAYRYRIVKCDSSLV